ncbi:hypothetical protein D3C84_1305310 [compost metagenome]
MAVSDFLGQTKEVDVYPQLVFGMLNGVAPQRRVGLHDLELLWGEAPGLEEDAIGDADLADIVQRC